MPAYYHVDASSDRIPLQIVRKELPLSILEKQYILAVERGDYAGVRQHLEEAEIYFNININCIDPLGRTALLISIQNENIEIIELLLKHNVNVGDALLHAIDEEVVEAVELLLNHKPPKKDIRVSLEFVNPSHQVRKGFGYCLLIASLPFFKWEFLYQATI